MPLLDHFRPPLSERRHWHAFHNAWATFLASDLNERLPPGYFAEPNVQFRIEIDVAAFEDEGAASGGSAGWSPPEPVQTVPFPRVTDVVEVAVYASTGGPVLVGALELVSPANKDRPAAREAFVAKCDAYLQQGVGLVVVAAVTTVRANLHEALLERLRGGDDALRGEPLYAAAYRVVRRQDDPSLDVWTERLEVGEELPALPLWLRGGPCLRVDLEASYARTCREQRLPSS